MTTLTCYGDEHLVVCLDRHGADAVLTARGVVDLQTMPLFADALGRLAAETGRTAVVDLSRTTFLACCAIGSLAALRTALETTRRRLLLCGERGVVRHVLMACELREVLGELSPAGTGALRTDGRVLGTSRRTTAQAASPGSAHARVSIV